MPETCSQLIYAGKGALKNTKGDLSAAKGFLFHVSCGTSLHYRPRLLIFVFYQSYLDSLSSSPFFHFNMLMNLI